MAHAVPCVIHATTVTNIYLAVSIVTTSSGQVCPIVEESAQVRNLRGLSQWQWQARQIDSNFVANVEPSQMEKPTSAIFGFLCHEGRLRDFLSSLGKNTVLWPGGIIKLVTEHPEGDYLWPWVANLRSWCRSL